MMETLCFKRLLLCLALLALECFPNAQGHYDGTLIKNMDTNALPCQDFQKFACGKFIAESKIPKARPGVGGMFEFQDKSQKLYRDLMEEPVKKHEPSNSFERKMKEFYKSCLDQGRIDRLARPSEFNDNEDWPTLNSWEESKFSLQNLLVKYESVFTEVLFKFRLAPEKYLNPKKYILEILQPDFLLRKEQLANSNRSDAVFTAFEQFYEDVAVYFGAEIAVAKKDAIDWMDFMIELGKSLLSMRGLMSPGITTYSTLEQMNTKFGSIDWVDFISKVFRTMDIKVNPDQRVKIKPRVYFEGLNELLTKTSKRTIQNTFGFMNTLRVFGDLTTSMRNFRLKADKVTIGTRSLLPRKRQCVDFIDTIYNLGLAKLVSERNFKPTAKRSMNSMVIDLKNTLLETLNENDWLSQDTKNEIILKIALSNMKLGVQDRYFERRDLNIYFNQHEVDVSDFMETRTQNAIQTNRAYLQDLAKPFKTYKWETSMTVANAFYKAETNEFVFPLGILQPPLFDANALGYYNYASLGYIVAFTMTSAILFEGTHIDHQGKYRNWWKPDDLSKFGGLQGCYVEQYNKFLVTEINKHVNGSNTLFANIADNIAFRWSYKAFMSKQYGAIKKNQIPVSLRGFTLEQLYFASTAQLFCSKRTKQAIEVQVAAYPMSPERYRIIGRVQNSKAFSEAYKCKSGDPMSPHKRCNVLFGTDQDD